MKVLIGDKWENCEFIGLLYDCETPEVVVRLEHDGLFVRGVHPSRVKIDGAA